MTSITSNVTATSTTFPYSEKQSALSINVSIENTDFKRISKSKHIMICLDVSGSMSGNPISQAIQAIKELVNKLLIFDSKIIITFITFNTGTIIYDFTSHDVEKIYRTLDTILAGGGTDFKAPFYAISQEISKRPNLDVSIVFLSDGEDSDPRSSLIVLNELRKIFISQTVTTNCNTIGFTSSHDVTLLSQMTTSGTVAGTFQYVKESNQISTSINNLIELLQIKSFRLSLKINSLIMPLKLNFSQDSNRNILAKGTVLIDANNVQQPMILNLVSDENSSTDIVLNSSAIIPDIITQVETSNDIIASKIVEFSNMMKSIKSNPNANIILNEVKTQIESHDKNLDRLSSEIFRMKSIQRKLYIPLILESKELIRSFYELLSATITNTTISNDKLASLNALAYKGVTKGSIQKSLDKRIIDNIESFNNLEAIAKQRVAQIDFDRLDVNEAEKIGRCMLSGNNYIEALKDNDCLCLCLSITRSQNAIMDPSQLNIIEIHPTIISGESFLDSVLYTVAKTPDAHGAFARDNNASILTGICRENISGVLPLYINDDHWSIAKLKMKPIFGYMTTLDILGYTYSQTLAIPFLALAKASQNTSTEFMRTQYKFILDTCVKIYMDSSRSDENNLRKDVLSKFTRYNEEPLLRTIDSIPSNEVFLSYLICERQMKDDSCNLLFDTNYMNMFMCHMCEEQIRRRQRKYENISTSDLSKLITGVLNIDISRYVTDHVVRFEQKENERMISSTKANKSSHASLIIDRLRNAGSVIENETSINEETSTTSDVPLSDSKDWVPNLINLTAEASQIIHETKHLFSVSCVNQMKMINLINNNCVTCDSLENIGFDTNEKLIAMSLQNIMQMKNSDRRYAIENKTYCNVLTESDIFLKEMFVRTVENMKQSMINDIITKNKQAEASKLAHVFGNTRNIYEAAGVLLGTYRGRVEFPAFYKTLQNTYCPLAKEKILMLITGEFQNILLFRDVHRTSKGKDVNLKTWIPWKRNLSRLLERNKDCMTQEEWKQMLPTRADYLDRRYELIGKE